MSMDNIILEKKLFSVEFRHGLKRGLVVCSAVLLLFMAFTVYAFITGQDRFFAFYRDLLLKGLQLQMKEIVRLPQEDRGQRIGTFISDHSKTPYVLSLWVTDSQGRLLASPALARQETLPPLPGHLWQFTPDGSVIPHIDEKKENDYLEAFFAVYGQENRIEYVTGLRMRKSFAPSLFLPLIKRMMDLKTVILACLGIFLIFLANLLITILALPVNKKNARLQKELLARLALCNPATLPFRFQFDQEALKGNFIADLLSYMNGLFAAFYAQKQEEEARQEQLRQIVPPSVASGPESREPVRVFVKPDYTDLARYVWELYFKDQTPGEINGYSSGIYHMYKDSASDILFRFTDLEAKKKSFFTARILEPDTDKKIVLLSCISYFLSHCRENVQRSDAVLAQINALVNRLGIGEMQLHAAYAVLDLETDYFEVSSTRFTPLILYKAATGEISYHAFRSAPLGARMSDEFLKELKKEAFRLDSGDILILPDEILENLYNPDGDKFEIYALARIVKENAAEDAGVIRDKIREKLMQFSVDFAKIRDLLFLVVKKT